MAALPQIGPTPALVTRPGAYRNEPDHYLRLAPGLAPQWTTDPSAATAFESMREATRAATRLPSGFRAFSLPLSGELHGLLH